MALLSLLFNLQDSSQALIDLLQPVTTSSKRTLLNYIAGIENGSYQMSAPEVGAIGPVSASGTVTFSSIAAADTVTIGATVFTGSNSPTGPQFQTNVTPSATADKAAAASLAAVINANAVTKLNVVASNVAGTAVVTITSIQPGTLGNFYPIAISAHGSVSGSGLLTSGTAGTAYNMAV